MYVSVCLSVYISILILKGERGGSFSWRKMMIFVSALCMYKRQVLSLDREKRES